MTVSEGGAFQAEVIVNSKVLRWEYILVGGKQGQDSCSREEKGEGLIVGGLYKALC